MMLVTGIFHMFTIPESYLIEVVDRKWLAYSKHVDESFVFAANYSDHISAMLHWEPTE
jgi:hypothetical protein